MSSFIQITKAFKAAILAFLLFTFYAGPALGQEQPPTPGAPRTAKIPAVVEKELKNGLTVATVERKNVPLVTVEILVKSGAKDEELAQSGLANMTASMLTKGTKTKTASQIAEQVEFLGGSISAAAGWNNSVVQISVTSDKLDQAMAILADVVQNPSFKKEELDLLKSQALDGLLYNLKQPGFLANYVASRYSFDEHPVGGTPETIEKFTVADVVKFKKENYLPEYSVLIFTGDIAPARANALAQKFFGLWRRPAAQKIELQEEPMPPPMVTEATPVKPEPPLVRRLLVVDLPKSGQASVNYTTLIAGGRIDGYGDEGSISARGYYAASVLNSVLGGGYSSRLNQEIRIKRGLSYGAGSSFAWRFNTSNFSTRTQTKNESAGEVAELVLAELKRLTETDVSAPELAPRKLVLTGDFGRDLETTVGLADKVGELYGFALRPTELDAFTRNVQSTSADRIREYARQYLKGGDLIIVGDYSVFKDDLTRRFPNMQVQVIKADELDLTEKDLLIKGDRLRTRTTN